MNKTLERQSYKEVEAFTSTPTATDNVVAMKPPRQPKATAPATPATMPRLPATQSEVAAHLKISRQMVGKYLKQLRTVYGNFPYLDPIEVDGKITNAGFDAIVKFQQSELKGQEYLAELESILEDESRIPTASTEVMAITPFSHSSASNAISRIDAEIESLEIEIVGVIDAISEVNITSQKFNEAALKQAALEGTKLGANRAKIKIAAMQRTENQMMEKLLNEMGLG